MIAVRNEKQFRSGTDPHAAVTDFQTRDQVQSFGEYLASFKLSVPIAIFKDNDPVQSLIWGPFCGVAVSLSDPNATTLIKRHCDRLLDVRLRCDQSRPKPFRHV